MTVHIHHRKRVVSNDCQLPSLNMDVRFPSLNWFIFLRPHPWTPSDQSNPCQKDFEVPKACPVRCCHWSKADSWFGSHKIQSFHFCYFLPLIKLKSGIYWPSWQIIWPTKSTVEGSDRSGTGLKGQWIPSFDEFDSSHQSFTVPVFTFITRSRFVILWQTFDRSCDINLCHMTHHVIDLDLVVDRTSSLI